MKNINLGATFLFLSILCRIKIELLLFLKLLKKLAFFDSYFWPFNKTHEKIIVIFVISAIVVSIWNVFIKFHWHDEKLTRALQWWKTNAMQAMQISNAFAVTYARGGNLSLIFIGIWKKSASVKSHWLWVNSYNWSKNG